MNKLNTSSKTLKKTTIQETVGSSFTKFLKGTQETKNVRSVLKFMVDVIIIDKNVDYIRIDNYIDFYKKIPLNLWATRPVFYFKDDKFDALGFLGERVHAFTLVTKTLDLYFQDGLDMHITHVLDNKEPKFINIDNPKDRMLAALEYLKENASVGDLKRAYSKAKKILHGRYY